MKIVKDPLTHPAVLDLIGEHLCNMRDSSPPERVHALDARDLCAPGITFFTAWDGPDLLGCGALKELDVQHGEIKSMHTATRHLRTGVATALLEHIIDVALARGYERLSLETGSGEPFDAALRFYEKHDFRYCEPFADYEPNSFSRFMTRSLAS